MGLWNEASIGMIGLYYMNCFAMESIDCIEKNFQLYSVFNEIVCFINHP